MKPTPLETAGGRLERLLCSYAEAARLLDASPEGVRGWVRRGLIKVVFVGRLPRIPIEELHRIATEGLRDPEREGRS